MSGAPVVSARGLVKRYPGVVALDHADLDLHGGEVLGLVGKNGAGKSSLIKVLAGVSSADEGEVLIDGQPLPAGYAPHVAHKLGLAFVHQELGNFPSLTVAENVALGTRYPRRAGLLIARGPLRRRVAAVLDELEAEIDPDAHAGDLSSVEQRVVMIARALYHDARVLVLDEPSVSLTVEEIGHLHAIVRRLRDKGQSVVYVSHRLGEIVSLTDRVVVMQDGRVTLERATSDLDEGALVQAIAGSAAAAAERRAPPAPQVADGATPLLRVRGLARPPRVADVSFDLHAGEILGIAGLVGSGRTEVARMVFGADRPSAGTIEVDGAALRARTPVDAIRAGIALLPEDRRHEGLVLDFDVRENVTLASLGRHRAGRLLPLPRRSSEKRATSAMIERLAIRTPSDAQEVRRLSGGNQQKVVLAKWLQRSERVLIFDEPAQGVDVGAKEEMFSLIRAIAAEGRAAIVISSDYSELVGLCTRVIALQEGRVTGTVAGEEITEEALVRLSYAAAA
ncbi:sugar ABC transporter ATP-binding protein [Conexibacter stalactiti]|uniref:Sugar ABC transporter ATP-binding protein n=1 Tax=Conexibacter stalactiti TaxID=1940611 RepID=A0ABU4HST0_9ACTN|nr:sugar ABC transporter ATP-binding protein [Conexibacter stalactiti]MDW5596295.1 sugar ABC transporter ATP-binding protein [Conexibacter stalactiti]MEC5036937.1 sugar ABC transporter ATP-binding protein [Conexibacter stalactiti]